MGPCAHIAGGVAIGMIALALLPATDPISLLRYFDDIEGRPRAVHAGQQRHEIDPDVLTCELHCGIFRANTVARHVPPVPF